MRIMTAIAMFKKGATGPYRIFVVYSKTVTRSDFSGDYSAHYHSIAWEGLRNTKAVDLRIVI